MKAFRYLCSIVLLAPLFFSISQHEPAIAQANSFTDQFNSTTLSAGWQWIDPLANSSYNLTDHPGFLRIYTSTRGHDLYMNLNAPRMMRSAAGNFVIKTKVTINSQYNYQGAGLLVWQDSNNYIRLERTLVSGIDLWYRTGGIYQGKEISFSSSQTVYLQISRSGNNFTGSFSLDNTHWNNVQTVSYPAANGLQVGLDLINEWQDNPTLADFDFFDMQGGNNMVVPDSNNIFPLMNATIRSTIPLITQYGSAILMIGG